MLAVVGLGIGIPVSVSHAQLDPAWTVALPGGAISLGLFLITLLLKSQVREAALKAEGIAAVVKLDGQTLHLLAGLNADQYAAEMRGQLAA